MTTRRKPGRPKSPPDKLGKMVWIPGELLLAFYEWRALQIKKPEAK